MSLLPKMLKEALQVHPLGVAGLAALALASFEHPAFYDALKRANEDLSGRLLSLLNVVLDVIGSLGGLAAIVGVMLTGHWALGPLVVIGSVPGVWVMMWMNKKTHYVYRERTPQYRETAYFRELMTKREEAMEVAVHPARPSARHVARESGRPGKRAARARDQTSMARRADLQH